MKRSIFSDVSSMLRSCLILAGYLCACAIIASAPAHAEVAQTGPGIYQEIGNLKEKIIATNLGIFVISSSQSIPLQKFEPAQIKKEGTTSAFIYYDAKSNTYSEVVLGETRFAVRGSFALEVGKLQIKVDNYATPYLTVVFNSDSKTPSIVPFNATTAFGVYTGAAAVSVLEANQAFAHIQDIAPYVVHDDGSLSLKGEKVNGGAIGLAIPQADNPCLLESAVFIDYTTLQRIKALTDNASKKKQLELAIERAAASPKPLSNAILLKVEERKKLIAFDPKDSQIVVIRPVSDSGEKQVCEVEKVKL